MSYTAKELESLISEKAEEYDGYRDVYEYLHSEETDVDIEGLPKLEFVESFGGYEGAGDTQWVVFKAGDQYFRVEGYYDSWGGGDGFDGGLEEVFPKQVMRTEWETK